MLKSQTNLRGIVAMMLAMLVFTGNDAFMKYARASLETGQALFVRGLFSLVLLAAAVVITGSLRQLPMALSRFALTRAGLEGMIAVLYIGALAGIALAEATAITMLAPLLITAVSTLVLGETVGWRRWSAIAIGFVGILLVLRPEGRTAPLWAVAMLFGSTLLIVARDILTRRMPNHVPSLMLTLATSAGTLVAGAALVVQGGVWRPLSPDVLMALAGAAVLVLIGNYAIIEAHRATDLSVVSPFRYSVMVWSVIMGAIAFGEVPSPVALTGLALILGSGVYTIHRERVRRRAERAAIAPE
jgi:drug/metabolite transporter (DMT)-like permease